VSRRDRVADRSSGGRSCSKSAACLFCWLRNSRGGRGWTRQEAGAQLVGDCEALGGLLVAEARHGGELGSQRAEKEKEVGGGHSMLCGRPALGGGGSVKTRLSRRARGGKHRCTNNKYEYECTYSQYAINITYFLTNITFLFLQLQHKTHKTQTINYTLHDIDIRYIYTCNTYIRISYIGYIIYKK